MPAPQQAANLLVLTSQAAEAERLAIALRSGGLGVNLLRRAGADGIDELLEQAAGCDLILCCSYDPAMDPETILARYRDLDTDVSLIVLTDPDDEPQTIVRALRAGARDVIERYDQDHLQRSVERELSDLEKRREAQRLKERLEQCEERSRELVDTAGEAIAFVQQGLHLHANPAYLDLFGFSSRDDLEASTFLDLIESEQRKSVRELLREREIRSETRLAELSTTCVRPDASLFPALLFASSADLNGEACVRVVIRELGEGTTLPRAPATAQRADLTGYPALIAAIQERIGDDGRVKRPFAVVCARVRSAPELILEFGLSNGLHAIGSLEPALREVAGSGAVVARISDDGFGLLMDGLDRGGIRALIKRARSEVHLAGSRVSGSRVEPDIDMGYVLAEVSVPSAAALLDQAYRSCFTGGLSGAEVKPTGQPSSPTSLATRGKQIAEDGDEAMAVKIEEALDNDRFLLVYQPIVSLMGDNQENYSVLVRLVDADEQLLEAREFIGAAIRHGLIERIDKWAIRQAIQAMAEHRRAGHKLNFFINLAEDAFRDSSIIVWICDCLREFDARGSWLTFVFQEELVEGNLVGLSKMIEGLKKIKCRVAVNRFGATERPQALFQGIPLDFVLLLPDFAQGLADDKDKQQRLLSLATLAREYNIKSVVTGVEDARALTVLWTAGVDYVQGNFLQRPSPTLEIAT